MSHYTDHYNMILPEGQENAKVDDLNNNFEILDNEVYMASQQGGVHYGPEPPEIGDLWIDSSGEAQRGSIFDFIYPIGSIYMSVNSTSPETLFGGTWVQIKDTFLLSAGDTYTAGTTGGSADAVVVEHSHSIGSAGQAGTGTTTYGTVRLNVEWASQNSGTTGVDGTGKNMPPYLTVYMWKRTS